MSKDIREAWIALNAEEHSLDQRKHAITKVRNERIELLTALKPFAAAFRALPESLQTKTFKDCVHKEHKWFSTYDSGRTETLVRVGDHIVRVGDLAHAAYLVERAAEAKES